MVKIPFINPSDITELKNVCLPRKKKNHFAVIYVGPLSVYIYRPVIILPILGDTCNGSMVSQLAPG